MHPATISRSATRTPPVRHPTAPVESRGTAANHLESGVDGRRAATARAPHWLLDPFHAIGLDQLNAKADMMERRDNKYVVSAAVLKQAMSELIRHFDILEIDGKRDFTYDTRYFDDVARSTYVDHHQGRRIRCKVRMRKYVDAGLCFVEVKLKHMRGMTIKERLQRPAHTHGTMDDEARRFVEASFSNLYGREFGRRLEPVLRMCYQRVTLVAKQGGERMTVDLGATCEGAACTRSVSEDLVLVEAKSGNANGIADKILRELHQHPTNSCSKYCVALAALNEAPKYNKFLVPLRKLDMVPVAQARDPWLAGARHPAATGRSPTARVPSATGRAAAAPG
jgi:hypothetical protein